MENLRVLHSLRFGAICLIGWSVFHGSLAWAQEVSASLNGSVIDASGFGIPGALVQATNPATGASVKTVSSEAGDYYFLLQARVRHVSVTWKRPARHMEARWSYRGITAEYRRHALGGTGTHYRNQTAPSGYSPGFNRAG